MRHHCGFEIAFRERRNAAGYSVKFFAGGRAVSVCPGCGEPLRRADLVAAPPAPCPERTNVCAGCGRWADTHSIGFPDGTRREYCERCLAEAVLEAEAPEAAWRAWTRWRANRRERHGDGGEIAVRPGALRPLRGSGPVPPRCRTRRRAGWLVL